MVRRDAHFFPSAFVFSILFLWSCRSCPLFSQNSCHGITDASPSLAEKAPEFSRPSEFLIHAVGSGLLCGNAGRVMDDRTRRIKEMGERVLEWSTTHPDPEPGAVAAQTRLQQLITRVDQLAAQQRDGILEVRRATARKRTAQVEIMQIHLRHVISAAELASTEEPELAEKFQIPGRIKNYASFRTAARGVLVEAESRRELLTKYGLSDSILAGLRAALDEFDAVVEQGAQGRARHVGASAALLTAADEILTVVRVMNGANRFRFAQNRELYSAWRNMSRVIAARKREPEVPPVPEAPTGNSTPPGTSQPAA
jgi:hypothetical protein